MTYTTDQDKIIIATNKIKLNKERIKLKTKILNGITAELSRLSEKYPLKQPLLLEIEDIKNSIKELKAESHRIEKGIKLLQNKK